MQNLNNKKSKEQKELEKKVIKALKETMPQSKKNELELIALAKELNYSSIRF